MRVSGEDWTRLGVDAERVAQFIGNRAFMRMVEGHCAALELRRSPENRATEFFCTLYENRPEVCRNLGRGSPECEGERVKRALSG